MEKVVRLPGLQLRRCRACSFRFATLGNSSLLLKDVERVFRKALVGTFALAGAILVLLVVLWFTGTQATYSPSESGALHIDPAQVG